jgi:transposase-like protein
MAHLSYRRHRFPPPIIQHAIELYLRFTLSYRDAEELLAERGLDVSCETVRRRVWKLWTQRQPEPFPCFVENPPWQNTRQDRAI